MTVVFFDLETGGTLPTHPTIQLAAIAVEDGREVGCFEQNIAFMESECDPEALKLNHYDRALWIETAVHPGVCRSRFEAWLRPYRSVTLTSKRTGQPYTVARLAGYNALTFDEPRLRAMLNGQFTPWEYRVRDVLQRVTFYFDEHPELPPPENFKLSTVAAYFGIDTDGAHGALADARMCAAVYAAITERR